MRNHLKAEGGNFFLHSVLNYDVRFTIYNLNRPAFRSFNHGGTEACPAFRSFNHGGTEACPASRLNVRSTKDEVRGNLSCIPFCNYDKRI